MKLTWHELSLHGFGRFESEVIVRFGDGMNVHVAPNEAGKSTLSAGLAAVLFGLPAVANPDDFGQARYRNWHEPLRFEGELQFSVAPAAKVTGMAQTDEAADGETIVYRVRRNFSNHAVTVSRRTATGWEHIVTGRHNPNARRPNEAYNEFLQRTVGMTSRELFSGTFFLGQPLPAADAVDEKIQQLVSGAGTSHYNDALERLLAAARHRTRKTGELQLSARDARNDGLLEQLDEEIAALRQAMSDSVNAVDAHEAIQLELSTVEANRTKAEAELQRVEKLLEAWRAWRDLRAEHRGLVAQQSRLQQAWGAYERLQGDVEREQRALEGDFPHFAHAGDDMGDKLDELSRLQLRLADEEQQMSRDLAALRSRGDELSSAWRDFVAERERLHRLEEQTRHEFAPFVAADDDVATLYADYDAAFARLQTAVDEAERAQERWERAHAAFAEAEDEFSRRFADLAWADAEAVAAVDERIGALDAWQKFQAERAEADREEAAVAALRRRRRGVVAAAGVVVSVVLGALTYAASTPVLAAVVSLLGFGATAVAAFLAGRQPFAAKHTARATDERRTELETALRADARLGPFAEAAAHELGQLRARLVARAEAKADLDRRRAALPAADEGRRLATVVRTTRAELDRFLERTEPARGAFGTEVGAAYRRWTVRRAELDAMRQNVVNFSRRRFGHETEQPEALPIDDIAPDEAATTWRALARMLRDGGYDVTTVGDVVAAWDRVDDDTVAQIAAKRGEDGELGRLRRRVIDARAALSAVLRAGDEDVDATRRHWRDYDARRETLRALAAQRDGVLAGHGAERVDELHVRAVDKGNRAMAAYDALKRLADEHPGLPHPDESAAEADGRTEVDVRVETLEATRDDLRRQVAAADATYRNLLERRAGLVGGDVLNIAAAEQRLAELVRRRDEVAAEVEVIRRAYVELQAAADEFQREHRTTLADAATEYFRSFTGRPRTVVVDERFRVAVQHPDGHRYNVSQLSQGAQDQLYVALRLAIADLVAADVPLPLLLDDPFVHCDEERLASIYTALAQVATRRQIVLFSHRDVFRAWGVPLTVHAKAASDDAVKVEEGRSAAEAAATLEGEPSA